MLSGAINFLSALNLHGALPDVSRVPRHMHIGDAGKTPLRNLRDFQTVEFCNSQAAYDSAQCFFQGPGASEAQHACGFGRRSLKAGPTHIVQALVQTTSIYIRYRSPACAIKRSPYASGCRKCNAC